MRFSEPRALSVAVVCGFLACLPHAVLAQPGRVDLPERIRGAERIVVGVVANVAPELQENQFGDQLIVSRTTVVVEEVLKGPANVSTVEVDIEGGTIGDLTLSVSDIESIGLGERGVFLLNASASGAFRAPSPRSGPSPPGHPGPSTRRTMVTRRYPCRGSGCRRTTVDRPPGPPERQGER